MQKKIQPKAWYSSLKEFFGSKVSLCFFLSVLLLCLFLVFFLYYFSCANIFSGWEECIWKTEREVLSIPAALVP